MPCRINIFKRIITHINIKIQAINCPRCIRVYDNLFYFPESYERLEEIVRMYPANKLDILNTNTTFIIRSEDSKGALKIRARFSSSSTSEFENVMDLTTGQLTFESNFRDKNCTFGLNATEVTSYQYLGMTKIAGALNMLPCIEIHNILKLTGRRRKREGSNC
jgi:hypothetical protein